MLSSVCFFFFQAEDGIRDLVRSRGLGDVYKRQQAGGGGMTCFRATYRRSARTTTSVTVVPSAAARSFTACHRSSGTRTLRIGVCVGRMSGAQGVEGGALWGRPPRELGDQRRGLGPAGPGRYRQLKTPGGRSR